MKQNISLKRMRISISILIVFVLAFVFIFADNIRSYADCQMLKYQLDVNSINAEECSYDLQNNMMKVSFYTSTDGDLLKSDSINDMRRARNVFRYEVPTVKSLSDSSLYNEIVKNSKGDVLHDSTFNLLSIPELPECGLLKSNLNTRYDANSSEDDMIRYVSSNHKTHYTYDENIGNVVHVELLYDDYDYDAVNQDISLTLASIDRFNSEKPLIHQLEISATVKNEEIIFFSADLIYRDFLWWQSPEMTESWTEYY